ncbi:hypothetical protein ABEB36_012569 [Hypothenemus hampei]|uniref:MADF domain-containing protein n=1 Tax=Hypothenemus hampei TaxID=57062 RepID=A0ABD1EBU1_HYPHA
MTLDVELFILEIESHPAIWDARDKNFSNRSEKRNAWEKICLKFISNFENKNQAEKNEADFIQLPRYSAFRTIEIIRKLFPYVCSRAASAMLCYVFSLQRFKSMHDQRIFKSKTISFPNKIV